MSADSYTEVTSESWFGRLGNAFKGIVVGLILFIIAFPLLFWNEGRAVKRHKTLNEGSGMVVSISSERVNPENEGKLVHVTGRATTNERLSDPEFGISGNVLKLKRRVQMYQWEENSTSETRKRVGGGTETITTYTYNKVWTEGVINSGNFKKSTDHRNPSSMMYQTQTVVAKNVSLGEFKLSNSLVDKISNFSLWPVDEDTTIPERLRGRISKHDNGFYAGFDPANPQIGDLRISFDVVQQTDVSIVSKQISNTFEPFKTKVGGSIELLEVGVFSAADMFQKAQQSNKVLTWVLRLVGFLIMMIGLNMILKPLSVIADILPILGNIVGAGTGLIAFLVSLVLSLLTVSIAWIVYRPLLGIILLVCGGGLTFLVATKLRKAKG